MVLQMHIFDIIIEANPLHPEVSKKTGRRLVKSSSGFTDDNMWFVSNYGGGGGGRRSGKAYGSTYGSDGSGNYNRYSTNNNAAAETNGESLGKDLISNFFSLVPKLRLFYELKHALSNKRKRLNINRVVL
jgi:hypothetical protein